MFRKRVSPTSLRPTMTSESTFIINDSGGESDGLLHGEPLEPIPTAPPFHLAPLHELNGDQTVPASGELRKKAIDEAHAALLSTTPASPTQIYPNNSQAKAKRRQTAHGRLGGGYEQDIYAFNASDDDGGFHSSSESKKRKRPSSEKKAVRTKRNDESDGYEEETKSSKKKPAKRSRSASVGISVLDLLNDSLQNDDWRPSASKSSTSVKKSTRNNTVDTDLLPPLPKPKRKPRESTKTTPYFDGNLTLGFNRSGDPSTSNAHNAEIQVAATEPGLANTFMIDLTHDELVLPHERRAEYDTISPELSAPVSPRHLPTNSPGGVYDTPDLRSTIPDPPYDSIPLPSQLVSHPETHIHSPEPHPLAPPSIASDSPLSSLENSPVAKPAKKPKGKKRAVTDQHLGLAFSKEDGHGFDSFPVASEWRAAKGKTRQGMAQTTYAGRAKTSNAVDLLAASGGGGSDDDVWTGDGKATQKKKKLAAKKRKSTVNDNEGTGEPTQRAKLKRKKSKPIETLVIGDSEDELSSGKKHDLSGSVQVAATASAENLSVGKQEPARPNVNQKHQIPEDEPYDPIADNNPILSAADTEQLVSEEYRPPGLGAGTKKARKWGRPKFLDEHENPVDPALKPDTPVVVAPAASPALVLELPPEPIKAKKMTAAAKRRKSKKDEEDGEDWAGDIEPARKLAMKNESKARALRVTKKTAATVSKEAKEQRDEEREAQLSPETIKGSDDDGNDEDLAPVVVISKPEPKPTSTKKAQAKKEPKPKVSKAAKKDAKAVTTSKETVSDAEDEEEIDKQENTTPAPESKPETTKTEPQTPSKELVERVKKTPHSPISKGPVKFRVGLSRRAHIEPLLKIIRK